MYPLNLSSSEVEKMVKSVKFGSCEPTKRHIVQVKIEGLSMGFPAMYSLPGEF